MEISFKNSFWDYVQFNWYQTFRSKKANLVTSALILFALGYLTLDMIRSADTSLLLKVIAVCIIFVGGFSISLLLIMAFILIWTLLVFLARNPKWADCRIQATEQGLLMEVPTVREEIQWTGIQAIEQNKRFIFIYVSKQMGYVVPKRAFAQEADANKFFTCINELWGKQKQPKSN